MVRSMLDAYVSSVISIDEQATNQHASRDRIRRRQVKPTSDWRIGCLKKDALAVKHSWEKAILYGGG